jgi:hypothetical protein
MVSKILFANKYLVLFFTDGLGQLSDGQTGPDNREDARGLQWVS